MPRLPRVTGAELVRALQRLGWAIVVQRGSHAQLRHRERGGRVTVPVHAGKVLGPGLMQAILKQAGVTLDELRRVL
jgi:predicted RNA binding protein YcfA (HicA-like mRNA interferase family)